MYLELKNNLLIKSQLKEFCGIIKFYANLIIDI